MEPKIVLVSKTEVDTGVQKLEQAKEAIDAVSSGADIIILDIDSIKEKEIQKIKREKDIIE